MVWIGSVFVTAGFVCQILIPLHVIKAPGEEKIDREAKE